jgi:signal peptidase I
VFKKTDKKERKPRKKLSEMEPREKFDYFLKEWVITIGVAFLVAFLFRSTVASPRHIPTGSMIPTIKIGEFIFVGMFPYDWHIPFTRKSASKRSDPKRGDIIVFEHFSGKDYIKRVIGVPGDIIEVVDKRIILNGQPLSLEPVDNPKLLADLAPKYDVRNLSLFKEKIGDVEHNVLWINNRRGSDHISFGPLQIPRDHFFVMGDNRDDSSDSRAWPYPFVPRDKILGEGSFIWFSFDKHHFPWVRFERLFTGLN